MGNEVDISPQTSDLTSKELPKSSELNRERNRLVVHLAKVFARRYDLEVRPSGKKGLWACSLDPKVTPEIARYVKGERETLEDLPLESFVPKQILYDEKGALEMKMGEITTLLRHEAGHAKFTDFRSMYEGQRGAKDEGYLSTSFWLMWEGLEDPRINNLEGEESPAIDRQIRVNQAESLEERLKETPLLERPLMLQFAYNSFYYWLNGGFIPELAGTETGRVCETAKPLLDQFFQNTDIEQRKVLQNQIWEIAKQLEKKEIEQEERRQVAEEKGLGQSSGSRGESDKLETGSGKSAGKSNGEPLPSEDSEEKAGEQPGDSNGRVSQTQAGSQEGTGEGEEESTGLEGKEKRERETGKEGLTEFSEEQIQEIRKAIEGMSPEQRQSLARKARESVDEAQKKALEETLSKVLKIEKNERTGEYEVSPQISDEKIQKQTESDYQQVLQEVESEEKAEQERQEEERRKRETILKQQQEERRQKEEMKKAGFEEDQKEKFLLYQSLEDAMSAQIRRFKEAVKKIIPRRKEPVYEGNYFSGSKFDRRALIKKAPLGDERFHLRQVEKPTGEARLFIGLLVDNSGTMNGKKIEEARKTMIFFAKVCREMGIPFMMGAFGDGAESIKTFRQDFDNPGEKIKPKLIDNTDASGGSTNLHAGLELTIAGMNEERRRLSDSHGLIFVITDGGANAGLVGDTLHNYIEEHKGRLTFKALGLSENPSERQTIQNYLNLYFGEANCAYPEGFEDLPEEAFRILRINFIQFQRFLS